MRGSRGQLTVMLPVAVASMMLGLLVALLVLSVRAGHADVRDDAVEQMISDLHELRTVGSALIGLDGTTPLARSVATLGTDTSVTDAFVVDRDGTVVADIHLGQIGEKTIVSARSTRTADALDALGAARRSGQVIVQVRRGGSTVVGAAPIRSLAHSEARQTLAYLVIERDLERTLSARTADAVRQTIFFALFVLIAAGLLWALLVHRVTRPLQRLTATAARLEQGDRSARSGIAGSDEVGALARRFDEMATHLELRQAQLDAMFEATPVGLAYVGHDGVIERANPTIAGYVDLTPADVVGVPVRTLLPDIGPVVAAAVEAVLETGEPSSAVDVSGVGARQLDGRFWCFPVKDATGSVVGAGIVALDETATRRAARERDRMVMSVASAQRMEVLGRLSASVAHDFNNLLGGILGYAHLARAALEDDPSAAAADLDQILDQSEHAAALVRQLLEYSRTDTGELVETDVNATIRAAEDLVGLMAGPELHVVLDLDELHGTVLLPPTGLERILANLATNARDALPSGGTIIIRTRVARSLPGEVADARERPADGYVLLSVDDDGPGITEAVGERAFEPFFTTRQDGTRTGVGLPTVRALAEGTGGTATIEALPGRGTRVCVYLSLTPSATMGDVVASEPTADQVAAERRSHAAVLVVDDDDVIRSLVATALARAGRDVLLAASGAEALRQLEGSAGDIALVLSDVTMPGMSGSALAEHVHSTYPEIPVVLMTGYTDLAPVSGTEVLYKPFTPRQLLEVVDRVLDGE